MVRYVTARHTGESDAYYQRGRVYPLAVKVTFFKKKVHIYKRRGYYDEMQPGTHRIFGDIDSFEQTWSDIKEESQ